MKWNLLQNFGEQLKNPYRKEKRERERGRRRSEAKRSEEKTNLFNPHDIGLNAPMEVKCKDVVKTKLSPDDSETKTMQ